ncbi:MAG: hypothetical protein DME42_08475 [Verrucomicrobia bacterium]|nr:MAG: hypothetical protein DME42_08475 [Verrucomicrobiota bacterium]
MKRFLIFASVCAFALTVFQSGGADVSINFFYDNLNGGNWYEVADYGYVWQPDAATNPEWRPYTDGYWAYTDVGWTWVSYEDFGWATYHYGRWIRLEDQGWCWVPGYEWGPAWVSWRTGGDYIGWAPLPPAGGGEIVYESRPIGGHVDVDFGIGPAYYNFIDIRFIGEPVLIGHYYPYTQNVVYINNTVNVTNITYNNSIVYNYGPDYAVLSRYSTRPIQRLKLERSNIDPLQAVKSGNVTKVQGDKLVLAAPLKVQKPTTQVAPKAIKAKITQPKIEKGWANISDPGTKAKLEQKLKTENPKNVPPPTSQPKAATANVSPLASPGASPFEKGKGKHQEPRPARLSRSAVKRGNSKDLRVKRRLRRHRDLRPRPNRSSRVRASTKARDSRTNRPYQADLLVLHRRNTLSKVRARRKARNSKANPLYQADPLLLHRENTPSRVKARRRVVASMASKMPVVE